MSYRTFLFLAPAYLVILLVVLGYFTQTRRVEMYSAYLASYECYSVSCPETAKSR